MATNTAFVIVGSANATALRRRFEHEPTTKVFSESEALEALRLILENPPKILALDSNVVNTARGALIVAQMQEHGGVDVRVLSEDDGHVPLLLARKDIELHAASRPIERCGTRGAKRFPMKSDAEVVVDGERSRLVNLSVTGAQVVLPARVQPRQSIFITLGDGKGERRFSALVAWAKVELAKSIVKYRAGVHFVDPDTGTLEAFCRRNSDTEPASTQNTTAQARAKQPKTEH